MYTHITQKCHMTVSTENTTTPKSTKSEKIKKKKFKKKSKIQTLQYLAVQIQIEIVLKFEFVPGNLRFSIWWSERVQHVQLLLVFMCHYPQK